MKEIQCIITGRVQMVMFRDFARRKARSLGLVGTAWNLDSGSVEVIAQGSNEKLEKFIEKLREGSLLSRVNKVEVVWREPKANFKDFHILF